MYLKAIQGHSGEAYSENARVNPALQHNVLFPKDFTKYVYHVGNGKEFRSIVRNGPVPGGFSTEQADIPYSLLLWTRWTMNSAQVKPLAIYHKARIAPYKNTWTPLQDTVYWCNLLLAQEGGLQFYQTRSDEVVPHDTLPAEFIEESDMHEN